MSDSTLNYFLARGTTAERLAFVPSPPSPANAPPTQAYVFWDTDLQTLFAYDFGLVDWVATGGGGSGGVGLSAGTQSVNTGTVVFSDANGVTFGMLGSSRITASVKTAYAGLNSAITGGSLTVNSSGISINLPAYLTTAMASNRGSDFVQATAVFNGTNASGTIASNAISISVDAGGGGNVNFSAGTTSSGLDSVVFSNSNGVSFGLNGSTITATVQTNYLTTAMASNRGSDFVQATAGFHGTNASGTIASDGISVSVAAPAAASVNFSAGTTSNNLTQVSFKDTNGVSFGLNAGTITATVKTDYQTSGNYLTTAMASNRGSDFVQATAAFHGTNISGTINSNDISISVGNYITTADLSQNSSKYVQAWELTGNTAGTTSSLQGTKLYFQGGNSITVSGSSNTVVFSVGNYLTTAALSQDSSKYAGTGFTTATTAGTAIVGTHNTAGLSMGVPAFITTGALSGDTSKYVQNWKLTGNTAGTTSSAQGTDLWIQGGANITLSGNSNTIVISAASAAAAPVNFSAGTTSNNLGTVVFSNSGGISFGLNGSTITASASTVGTATTVAAVGSANSIGTITRWAAEDHVHAGIGAIGISTGNTLGTSGSVQGTYWIVGGSNQTISQITSNNGSHSLVISGKNEGYNGWLEPNPMYVAGVTVAPVIGNFYIAPFTAYGSMSGGRINYLMQNVGTANLFLDIGETAYKSATTGTLNQSYTFSAVVALFSQPTDASSTQLQSFWSNSQSFGWTKVLNVSTNAATNIAVSLAQSLSYVSDIGSDGGTTNVQYANAGSSTIANSSGNSTLLSTVFSSGRNIVSGSLVQPFAFNTTISAGIYWLGYAWSATRASASTGGLLVSGSDFSLSVLHGVTRSVINNNFRNLGSTAAGTVSEMIPMGRHTAANIAPPNNIDFDADLATLGNNWVPYFAWNQRGLTK